jgi:biotin synthase-like enzyme
MDVYVELDELLVFFMFSLLVLLLIIYVTLRCCKKICNYCGWNFILLQIKKKNKTSLNEEVVSEISKSN